MEPLARTVPESLQVAFCLAAGFGETVFPEFVTLLLGAVLTTGRHTVRHVVRVVRELTVLVALDRNEQDNRAAGRRHKTPPRPEATTVVRAAALVSLVFAGDGGSANHLLTRFARRYQKRLTLVSRFSAAAALPERDRHPLEPTWTGKTTVTFSEAITLVRRDLWRRWIFVTPVFKLILQILTPNRNANSPTRSHWQGDGISRVS